jgi:hypothetical protein
MAQPSEIHTSLVAQEDKGSREIIPVSNCKRHVFQNIRLQNIKVTEPETYT